MSLRPHIPRKWSLYGWAALILFLLFYAIVGERGAIHLWRLQGEKAKLDEQNYRLQKANEQLRAKINRLRNDDFYLEKVAREELNMVRPGEVIYRFAPPHPGSHEPRLDKEPAAASSAAKAQKSRR